MGAKTKSRERETKTKQTEDSESGEVRLVRQCACMCAYTLTAQKESIDVRTQYIYTVCVLISKLLWYLVVRKWIVLLHCYHSVSAVVAAATVVVVVALILSCSISSTLHWCLSRSGWFASALVIFSHPVSTRIP